MDGPLVKIDGVTKRFAKTGPPAIDAVTASIAAGAVTGVVGPDGAGKTTLLRLMAGLLTPDEGALTVSGFDSVRGIAEARPQIAYMPQHFGLYEDLTVIENLRFYADLRSVDEAERGGVFERLLDFTDLTQFTKRRAGKLSGGMKQKLGLACALMGAPRLLLLDEPSVGVDPISRRELWRMTLELADEGIGVVWSTAYLDEAERCKSVLLLSEGKPVYHGLPADFTQKVDDRIVLIRNMPGDKRDVLMQAMELPAVLDGVIQGNAVRLVLTEPMTEAQLRDALLLEGAKIEKIPPRFEDAFMASLGGGPKTRSPFSGRPAHGVTPDEVVIKADALTKKFGDFTAADEISFSIRRGEVFGLIG
ncbi:MAG: ATP-binding cassette domain-containing protein, partial [Parvularculaceae bacterium]